MKIKTLLLGTVAAAGISTAAMAADPAVLTSLDVCDALGISGLTISSDSNCLQISGNVAYSFDWGDYNGTVAGFLHAVEDNDWWGALGHNHNHDWDSEVDAWLQFVGSADSDFGTASATIRIGYDDDIDVNNEGGVHVPPAFVSSNVITIDQAFVSIGDATVLTAGKVASSIASLGHDTVYNWLGSEHDNFGVTGSTGGHAIQLESDLGNGVDVGIALEDLAGLGSIVGVLNYSGDTLAAHITVVADDILTGTITSWGVHAGAELTLDMFKFLVAGAYDSFGVWNVVASAEATFDMFVLAVSADADAGGFGVGGSISADVTDTITVKLGGTYDVHALVPDAQWKVAGQIAAKVTETITVTAEAGVDGVVVPGTTVGYGSLGVAWNPGGGFKSSLVVGGNAAGAYKVSFDASKSFE